jgi:hypothetical protein
MTRQVSRQPFWGVAIFLCALTPALAESASPAQVTHPVKEADLTTVTLAPEAMRRLGLVTVPVESRVVTRTRLFGGEITVPARPGAAGGSQSVFTILSSLSPAEQVRLAQSQIEADGQVTQARVQLDGAQQALRRAEQMRRDKVGTDRTVDEARIGVGQAEAGLRTAEARRDLLGPAILEAASPAEVWVRAPVYVGDLPSLDRAAAAHVVGLSNAPADAGRAATPVGAPPSANPAAASVDLFYRLPNPDSAFRLGQRVGVTIPLRQGTATLAAPWSAIVFDADGGAWVYEQTGAATFVRRRVQVERAVGDVAVLVSGVRPGARVVATGAAELFGVEFGVGK